jgi:hypothetical protein
MRTALADALPTYPTIPHINSIDFKIPMNGSLGMLLNQKFCN